MPYEWIAVLAIPALVVVGVVVRFVRLRRAGVRGSQLFRQAMKPVSIAMQGESVQRGLPVAKLDVIEKPRDI